MAIASAAYAFCSNTAVNFLDVAKAAANRFRMGRKYDNKKPLQHKRTNKPSNFAEHLQYVVSDKEGDGPSFFNRNTANVSDLPDRKVIRLLANTTSLIRAAQFGIDPNLAASSRVHEPGSGKTNKQKTFLGPTFKIIFWSMSDRFIETRLCTPEQLQTVAATCYKIHFEIEKNIDQIKLIWAHPKAIKEECKDTPGDTEASPGEKRLVEGRAIRNPAGDRYMPGEIQTCRTFAAEKQGSLRTIYAACLRWDIRPKTSIRLADIVSLIFHLIAARGYCEKGEYDRLANAAHIFANAVKKLLPIIKETMTKLAKEKARRLLPPRQCTGKAHGH